jgi:ATP-dependent RNA helicase DeaD
LAQEFDIIDVAAAAIAMANDGPEKPTAPETATEPERPQQDYEDRGYKKAGPRAPREHNDGPMTLQRLSVGKEEINRPSDLVGAIAGEARISSSVIGAIKVHDDYSLVEVPEELAERIVSALKATKIRGHKVTIQSKPAVR